MTIHPFKKLTLFALILAFLSACSIVPGNQQGALQVTSTGAYSVYLDDTHLGQVPFFDERIKTGEYTLRLVPASGDEAGIWQVKVRINKRALTVVHYEPATNPEEASSQVMQLEPLPDKDATRLSISTLPDNVIVKINNEIKGFSPISFDDLGAGDFQITLESPGYNPKIINAKTTNGHHLIIQAHLARKIILDTETTLLPEASSSASIAPLEASESGTPETTSTNPSPSPTATPRANDGIIDGQDTTAGLTKPFVRVLQASPGIDWLRVRSEPNGLANNEVAKVRVGTYFQLVEESEDNQWFLIEYQNGEEGWIASRYGQLFE